MTLEALKNTSHVIGIKQVMKAVNKGTAAQVFIADDADERVTRPLLELCAGQNVKTVRQVTMKELGAACSIEVGAAAVAVLKSSGC